MDILASNFLFFNFSIHFFLLLLSLPCTFLAWYHLLWLESLTPYSQLLLWSWRHSSWKLQQSMTIVAISSSRMKGPLSITLFRPPKHPGVCYRSCLPSHGTNHIYTPRRGPATFCFLETQPRTSENSRGLLKLIDLAEIMAPRIPSIHYTENRLLIHIMTTT